MSHPNQTTLGLFDNTALGWTVHTPLPEPQPSYDIEEDEHRADAPAPAAAETGHNFYLDSDRALARGWPARARDNLAAIQLSKQLETSGRAPTADEQAALLRFIGFGATDLAQHCFPLPGVTTFRPGWEEIGTAIAEAVTPAEYAALQRATQYAHYTPEPIIRGLWRAAQHLGFTGGRVLEPGMGTGLFFALLPETLRATTRLTGIEYDPVTARIARTVHPQARVLCEDYTRSQLAGGVDLAIGNPPFADRIVRADPTTASMDLRLHDYFIARSIARLRPGGIALFVSSTGTMDKASTVARTYIAGMADLIGAVRLPESSMRATAGTDVVIDVLVFQRRAEGQTPGGKRWVHLTEIPVEGPVTRTMDAGETDAGGGLPDARVDDSVQTEAINEYFVAHPEMVLGTHAMKRGIYGPQLAYTCRARAGDPPLEEMLDAALSRLPANIFSGSAESTLDEAEEAVAVRPGTAAEGATIKEGSYLIGPGGRLMQIVDGAAATIQVREGKGADGIQPRSAKIIRALLPVRDAVREVLRAQAADGPGRSCRSSCASPTRR